MFFPFQNQIKATKEALKARLTEEHKYILQIAAFKLDLSMEVVVDFVVDCEEVFVLCMYE